MAPKRRPRITLFVGQASDGGFFPISESGGKHLSVEAQHWLREALAAMDAVLMDEASYQEARDAIRARRRQTACPRIVCCERPEAYAPDAGPGLRFTSEPPGTVLATLAAPHIALLGSHPLVEALSIDEAWILVEPEAARGTLPKCSLPADLRPTSSRQLSSTTLVQHLVAEL